MRFKEQIKNIKTINQRTYTGEKFTAEGIGMNGSTLKSIADETNFIEKIGTTLLTNIPFNMSKSMLEIGTIYLDIDTNNEIIDPVDLKVGHRYLVKETRYLKVNLYIKRESLEDYFMGLRTRHYI